MLSYELRTACPAKLSGYTRFSSSYIAKVPIRAPRESERSETRKHDRIVESVDRMLSLHGQLYSAKREHQKTVLQCQIESTDGEIDRLVYELYGLREEEIAIVEEATQ